MAIYHCTVKAVSRSTGRSAPGAAAYRAGEILTNDRTGEIFDYTRKGGVLSADIVLPENAPDWTKDRNQLWNAAEAAERRKDACVAREYEVALPYELTGEQRRELALKFSRELAERHGVAVDCCLHAPSKDGNDKNFHAHILTTTRVVGPEGLGEKADIEKAGRRRTDDLKATRALWSELCNEALELAGQTVRVDHRSNADLNIMLDPTKHVGVSAVALGRKGMMAERVADHEMIRADNALKIAENPLLVVEKISRTQAVFDRRDIARELHRYIDDAGQFQALMMQIEASNELVQLAPEARDGRRTVPAKLTTREMIETEGRMLESARALDGSSGHGLKASTVKHALGRYGTISAEQRAAVEAVTGDTGLSIIVGDAGTGKSFAMRVAKEAWEAEGYRVRGCALAGKAADELQAGSGIDSRTIHSLEASWNRGLDKLTSRDVLVIDEAGMVGSRQLGRVLAEAEKAGAKVVMLGDDKQLAAIEAGAGFRALTERLGASEITEIRRQKEGWAREASTEFARGDVRRGLDAYMQRGHVRMSEDRAEAKKALAADYLADRERVGSSIILAHTNADVRDLNAAIREARKQAGELADGVAIATERGTREFAAGDRLVFLKNDSVLGVKNGTLGTIERAGSNSLSVRLDDGRKVSFDPADFADVDHGYAVTIHKAQGVTVDRAYVLATSSMDRSLAYVGMTRHREAATLYAGVEDFSQRAGRLVEHGAAPYEHDPENRESYFVTLENDKGVRRTIWGVDLERAIADSGAGLGDRIGLEHVGSETVQLPDGQLAERNSWRVRDSAGVAYDTLAGRLAEQRPKESTLDFPSAAYGFADVRGFDGAGVVRHWIERGRDALGGLTERAEKALGRVLEAAGVRRDVPPMQTASAEQIEALRKPEREKQAVRGFVRRDYSDAELIGDSPANPITPEEARRAGARAEVERALGGSQVERGRDAGDPLARYRAEVEKAEASGDGTEIAKAKGIFAKAAEYVEQGDLPARHGAELVKAGETAALDYLRGGMSAEEARKAAARAEVERALGGTKERQHEQPAAGERDKAREEVERAMSKGRDRGGIGF